MKLKDAIHLFKSVREISRLSLQQLPWAYNDWCDGKYRGKLYYTAFTVGNNAPVNVMSPNPGFKCESWNMDRECVHVVMGCGCVWFPLWLLCSLPYASVDGGSLWCMFHNFAECEDWRWDTAAPELWSSSLTGRIILYEHVQLPFKGCWPPCWPSYIGVQKTGMCGFTVCVFMWSGIAYLCGHNFGIAIIGT